MPLLRFIPETTNVDFVKYRFIAFAIDGLLVLISVISIAVHGFSLGIDFTGGVLLEVKAAQTVDVGKVRADVSSLRFNETEVQFFGGGACDTPVNSCVMVRVQPRQAGPGENQELIYQQAVTAIKGKLGPAYTFRNAEVIGPNARKTRGTGNCPTFR